MFYFIIEIIVVSIAVNLLAIWTKMIPRYAKRRHAFMRGLINTGLLTILLTILFIFNIYPSWLLLFILILFILWSSIRITARLVGQTGEPLERPDKKGE